MKTTTKAISVASIAGALAMTPIAAVAQDSSRTTELYHIFDFKTAVKRGEMIKVLQDGINPNISKSNTVTPIVMGPAPETPGRFTLVNPFENSPYAGFISTSQLSTIKQARCDGGWAPSMSCAPYRPASSAGVEHAARALLQTVGVAVQRQHHAAYELRGLSSAEAVAVFVELGRADARRALGPDQARRERDHTHAHGPEVHVEAHLVAAGLARAIGRAEHIAAAARRRDIDHQAARRDQQFRAPEGRSVTETRLGQQSNST